MFITRYDDKGRIQLGQNVGKILGLKKNDRLAVLMQGKKVKIERLENVLKAGIKYAKDTKKGTGFGMRQR
jgi:hypothetical protein